MKRVELREKLLEELFELLADHQRCALADDGKYDPRQRERIARAGFLIVKLQAGQRKRI
jgi:hypothetical protein